jgi:hypothetical protein
VTFIWTASPDYAVSVGIDGQLQSGPASSGGVTLNAQAGAHAIRLEASPSNTSASVGTLPNTPSASTFQFLGVKINSAVTPSGYVPIFAWVVLIVQSWHQYHHRRRRSPSHLYRIHIHPSQSKYNPSNPKRSILSKHHQLHLIRASFRITHFFRYVAKNPSRLTDRIRNIHLRTYRSLFRGVPGQYRLESPWDIQCLDHCTDLRYIIILYYPT